MTVREKVMIGLAACMPETEEEKKIGCEDCPYGCCKADAVRLPKQMIADIRDLLKPVKMVKMNKTETTCRDKIVFEYYCQNCNSYIMKTWVACPVCGKAVKWE